MIFELKKNKEPKLLPDRYLMDHTVLSFRLRDFMFEVFDEKIQQLVEGHFIAFHLQNDNRAELSEVVKRLEIPFKDLTIGELEAGFVVSTSPLILSLMVFCFEWLVTLKDLLVFLCIFKTYFKMRSSEQDQLIELGKMKIALLKIMLDEKSASRTNIQSSSNTAQE